MLNREAREICLGMWKENRNREGKGGHDLIETTENGGHSEAFAVTMLLRFSITVKYPLPLSHQSLQYHGIRFGF